MGKDVWIGFFLSWYTPLRRASNKFHWYKYESNELVSLSYANGCS